MAIIVDENTIITHHCCSRFKQRFKPLLQKTTIKEHFKKCKRVNYINKPLVEVEEEVKDYKNPIFFIDRKCTSLFIGIINDNKLYVVTCYPLTLLFLNKNRHIFHKHLKKKIKCEKKNKIRLKNETYFDRY